MIVRILRHHAYGLAVFALTVAACVIGVFAVINIVVPEMARAGYLGVRETPAPALLRPASPSPSPSTSPPTAMRGVVLPVNADCSACHLTDSGAIGVRPIPPMGHPLEGWTQCTACHSPAGLVKTAPGHSGIHASDCLTCHKPGRLPAPLSRPHRDRQNVACLECHGSTAPLPTDMAHRSQSVCWLCHRLPDVQPPVPDHPTVSGETDCLSCHATGRAVAPPADHAGRTSSQCLLCHALPLAEAPPVRLEDSAS